MMKKKLYQDGLQLNKYGIITDPSLYVMLESVQA